MEQNRTSLTLCTNLLNDILQFCTATNQSMFTGNERFGVEWYRY